VPRRQTPWSALLLLHGSLVVLTIGCADVTALRRDVVSARQRRFEAWRQEVAGIGGDRAVIEGDLSISDCVRIGLANSRTIRRVLQERIRADARLQEAWAEAFPEIVAGATYTRLDKTPRTNGIRVGSINNYGVDGTITQPLWRGGAISAGIRASALYLIQTDELVRSTFQQVLYEIRKAYLDARLAFDLQEAARQSVEASARALEDVRRDREVGLAADFDVLRAEVQLKNFQAAYVQAQNRYHLALSALLNTMNVSQESQVRLSDALAYRPFAPEMERAVEAALTRHPDLLQKEYAVRIQKEVVTVEKSGFYPRLDAFITGRVARPDPHKPADKSFGSEAYGGIAATYKVFEGFRTVARVRQAKATMRQAEEDLRLAEERILLDIRQAILSIEDAARFVESQEANVAQAEEALRLVELGRRQGIRRDVEVLDAESALDTARANYAQAVYDHEIARLNLEKAMGALEPPPDVPVPVPPPEGPLFP